MASIITGDLSQKLDDLDLDKDPFHIAGELVLALQSFDEISGRDTLSVIKPKLEQWLASKLVSIREVVARGLSFETWTPISEVNSFQTYQCTDPDEQRVGGQRVLHAD